MKRNVATLRYMSSDEFRVLGAAEQGSKNHEIVPTDLIVALSRLPPGTVQKVLTELMRMKLLSREANAKYDGFRLTYGGYDYLALKTFAKRGTLFSVGQQIGVGKESDIHMAACEDGTEFVLKVHRLGRTSFRTVRENRDYLITKKHASWIYLSRLSATKEHQFMQALHENGFPVPRPIDHSRHCVLMEHIEGVSLCDMAECDDPGALYSDLMDLLVRLAAHGLIHGDFNEFNIIVRPDGSPVLIDFPQMVSTDHPNAEEYFNRDVECLRVFFRRKFGYESLLYPRFNREGARECRLDVRVAASGAKGDRPKGRHRADTRCDESGDGQDSGPEGDCRSE